MVDDILKGFIEHIFIPQGTFGDIIKRSPKFNIRVNYNTKVFEK